jgi:hypothetical protein
MTAQLLKRATPIPAFPLASSRPELDIPEIRCKRSGYRQCKGHAGRHTTTQASQAARLRRRGAAKETERRQLNETVAEIQRRYRELQEAEREERRKCAEAYKAEREARERDKPKRRPKPGRAFPLDPIGPPQLIKRRDYELRC